MKWILFFTLLPLQLHAALSNEYSLLVGDLSAGMGAAAVAVVGDAAGASYYNPATLAPLTGQAFSAAVGIYKKFDIVYGKDEEITSAPLRVNQGFFRSLPASTGSVIRTKKLPGWTMALSVVVPDYEQFKGELKNENNITSTLNYTDESLWVGGAMSRMISANESFGFTLYYTARNYTRTASDKSLLTTNHSITYTHERNQTENGILPVLGYYNQETKKFGWGVSARLPVLKIQGRTSIFENNLDANGGTGVVSQSTTNISERAVRVYVPPKITLGFSYKMDDSWLFAGDVSLREGYSYQEIENYDQSARIQHRAVWNGNLGVQKIFADWIKARMGVYTNLSSQPNPDPTIAAPQEDRVDMLGFSANLVFVAGQKISYTFGGYYTGGRGRSIQRIEREYIVVQRTVNIFTMLIGTSFSF